MLRLYNVGIRNFQGIVINEDSLILDKSIWKKCKENLKQEKQEKNDIIHLTAVKNQNDELIAYGYQDNEANRELRMLRELQSIEGVLQFQDVFPEYKEVVIYGCNELAVSFAEYLEEIGIKVSVIGAFWDYFGRENDLGLFLTGGGQKLVIYAEGIPLQSNDLYQTAIRSVSPEFECIDRIYEENVLAGKIQDTIGDFEELIRRLSGEQEIVLIGEDRTAQDTYDMLLKYGVDICCFAFEKRRNEGSRTLLGKPVISIIEAMQGLKHPVFICSRDVHGALGVELTEYFDYRGYRRNEQFFLFRDYTDIPCSNLTHVLRGKNVLLAGDARLCQMLTDYLNSVDNGDVHIRYISENEKILSQKDDILCLVVPDYHNGPQDMRRKNALTEQLKELGFVNYTEYFINHSSFVLIDNYFNCNTEKYTISELTPKGIFLGRIPAFSGNVFFRGIMDGHPEVLNIAYNCFNNNLFYYCVRLAYLNSEKILEQFWEMYNHELAWRKVFDFPSLEKFEKKAKQLLGLKKWFTSQELFVLFHIAYAEMSGREIVDISKLVIYWEPHNVSRDVFPFLALWLEDKKIDGQMIALRRNHVARVGSQCARAAEDRYQFFVWKKMFLGEVENTEPNLQYSYWTEYKMRFEDIKLYPKQKLTEICNRLGIAWSDTMLKTTDAGKPLGYRGNVDFDLKAVFNKREDYLSEFDRFRISIAGSPYQKKYGYSYYNCLKFSRKELQELFLKPFLNDEKNIFGNADALIKKYEWIGWKLWYIRKHMVLDDILPEFESN